MTARQHLITAILAQVPEEVLPYRLEHHRNHIGSGPSRSTLLLVSDPTLLQLQPATLLLCSLRSRSVAKESSGQRPRSATGPSVVSVGGPRRDQRCLQPSVCSRLKQRLRRLMQLFIDPPGCRVKTPVVLVANLVMSSRPADSVPHLAPGDLC